MCSKQNEGIIGINESKTLTKHVSCGCQCKFDDRECNSDESGIMIKVDTSTKKHICDYV